ncbi:ADP-ribose glycohydrolase MACROD1 isoform 3 [Mus musculus]|uniref:ADP-ribose glycohydrolase MACROD1 isoform 3 n=1 Tax=Mus musculus TaxID=10090 RepID=UPI0003D7223E|nr:ADP-ribose glycohydrolase MACROD1 isoform 3 [Mus musculus]|eukprot:XP_006526627.1 PREDICTED: O-acetyl-ADP-ribose deacetylase MACROD1 isoform X3 [Mus musculus]
MSLQSQVSGRLAQLRAAGQLLVSLRPWPGRSAGGPRPRGSACGPLVALGEHGYCAWLSAGVGAWGAAGRGAWVRTWAPLAMAAKVDLSTSTDWKEAKSFLKGLSDKQREEHYFCKDFIKLKKIPTWKETAKGLAVKVEDPKYKKDKQLNEKISLYRGDITKLEVDAIVNAGCTSSSGRMLLPTPEVLRKSLGSALPWHLTLLVTAEGVRGTQLVLPPWSCKMDNGKAGSLAGEQVWVQGPKYQRGRRGLWRLVQGGSMDLPVSSVTEAHSSTS